MGNFLLYLYSQWIDIMGRLFNTSFYIVLKNNAVKIHLLVLSSALSYSWNSVIRVGFLPLQGGGFICSASSASYSVLSLNSKSEAPSEEPTIDNLSQAQVEESFTVPGCGGGIALQIHQAHICWIADYFTFKWKGSTWTLELKPWPKGNMLLSNDRRQPTLIFSKQVATNSVRHVCNWHVY